MPPLRRARITAVPRTRQHWTGAQDSFTFMAKGNFGEHLRREREMRGVSLDEIASATRIQVRFLEALENEKWETLPGGVFNRGFVRSVARYLGLDEEAILGEYTIATGDRGTASSVPTRSLPVTEPPGQWIVWVIAVAFVALLVGGGIYGWRRHAAKKRASENPVHTSFSVRSGRPGPPRVKPVVASRTHQIFAVPRAVQRYDRG
jgi:cytoskeletal protein RodZ